MENSEPIRLRVATSFWCDDPEIIRGLDVVSNDGKVAPLKGFSVRLGETYADALTRFLKRKKAFVQVRNS